MTSYEFFDAARTYCFLTNASVTRFGSSRAHQAKLDPAVKQSPHVYWLGADVEYDGAAPADGVEIAERLGMKLLREPDHDHLQPMDWRAG